MHESAFAHNASSRNGPITVPHYANGFPFSRVFFFIIIIWFLKESQSRTTGGYREMAIQMHLWIREKLSLMQDRSFPNSLPEIKRMVAESNRFRNEEIPAKQREKQRLHSAFRDLTVCLFFLNL